MSSLSPGMKMSAYLLGRRIAGQRRKPERVPVAYLYNGVRLPGLPDDWDTTTYPYGAIFHYVYAGSDDYYLYYSAFPIVYSGGLTTLAFVNPPCAYRIAHKTGWYQENILTGQQSIANALFDGPVWANHNVDDKDGNLYLAASDPVPIYK